MKTVMQLDNLQILGSTLQERLCAAFPDIVYFQVHCLLEDGMLMVEIEHPQDSAPAPEALLPVVEAALADLHSDAPLPVNLYVKVPGEEHPYGLYSFTLPPIGKRSRLKKNSKSSFKTKSKTAQTQVFADDASPWDAEPSDSPVKTGIDPQRSPRSPWVKWGIGLGSLAGLGVLGVAIYGLTRPCVVGGCTALASAQKLQEESKKQEIASRSPADTIQAQRKLETAIANLETIPTWSGAHSQAESLKGNYQKQIARLEIVRLGLERTNEADNKSQNPPHSVAEWREIERLRQNAISNLQQIPSDSPSYPLAQAKIKESRSNLASIKAELAIAQKAENFFQQGQEKARVAKALQGIAQSPNEWQKVKATWQESLAQFQKIDKGTAAEKEAQKLITNAKKQLEVSNNRQSKEQTAANNFNSAQKLAQNAQNFQAIDQWPQAVASWNTAINSAQQIPTGTFYYGKVQPLIPVYQQAFKEAKSQAALADRRQRQAQQVLKKLCSTKPEICQFKIANNIVQVKLTPTYTQAVKQASITARNKGDYNAQVAIVDRVLALGEALNAASNNFKLRLELLGDNGKLIQVYEPEK
jgi:hypothetical protein